MGEGCMVLLERLDRYASEYGDRIAFKNILDQEESLSYAQLKKYSDRIANYIRSVLEDDKIPIIVYGHKSSMMLVTFLACVKAGHPYCPVDSSIPRERMKDIIEISGAHMLIATEECDFDGIIKLSYDELYRIAHTKNDMMCCYSLFGEETFYIIFTSGSTGNPKGVQITVDCLDHFLEWSESLIQGEKCDLRGEIFLDQALYSFDLSVMDLYTSLYMAGTVWALDRRLQENMGDMFRALEKSGVTVWVSTPSFVNMLLKFNTKFDYHMLPFLHTFLFCGEILTNGTVLELQKRFPDATVVNTYGPTESTVAVTQIVINSDMAKSEKPLSIGEVKSGTRIYILDDDYVLPEKPDGEKGEIVICGNTLAKGYLNRPDLTEEKFFMLHTPDGDFEAYKTGDIGYKMGSLLYYLGRRDFQVKINGYRIEPEDIECNIRGFSGINECVVLPINKQGGIRGVAAFISTVDTVQDESKYAQMLREYLVDRIPGYMIPRRFVFLDKLPLTVNGKVDRAAMAELL